MRSCNRTSRIRPVTAITRTRKNCWIRGPIIAAHSRGSHDSINAYRRPTRPSSSCTATFTTRSAISRKFEAAWYQPLRNAFAVTPSLRYAKRRRFLFRSAARQRPGARRTIHGRHEAFSIWRPDGIPSRRQAVRSAVERRHLVQLLPTALDLALGGSGSGGLLPVSARGISIGVSKTF
jgi:hypothetical protein